MFHQRPFSGTWRPRPRPSVTKWLQRSAVGGFLSPTLCCTLWGRLVCSASETSHEVQLASFAVQCDGKKQVRVNPHGPPTHSNVPTLSIIQLSNTERHDVPTFPTCKLTQAEKKQLGANFLRPLRSRGFDFCEKRRPSSYGTSLVLP